MKCLGLPFFHADILPNILWNCVQERVNHRGGFQRIPLPQGIGHYTFVNDVTEVEIEMALDELKSFVYI